MTLPGVAHGVALTLIAALGDITRFRDGDHAASYLGLTPIVRQSAGKCYRGSITKAGSSTARAMLTQAAQHAAEHPGPLGAFYRRLKKRKARNVAIVATARKLVTIAFLMLKNNEPYRYARPERVQAKLRHVERAAEAAGKPSRAAIKADARGGAQGSAESHLHPRGAARGERAAGVVPGRRPCPRGGRGEGVRRGRPCTAAAKRAQAEGREGGVVSPTE